jgi:hypothetical protein
VPERALPAVARRHFGGIICLFASQFAIINPAHRFKTNPSLVVRVEPDTAIGVARAHGPMEGDMWVAVTALVLAAAIGFDVIAVARRRSDHSDLTDKV